MLKETPKSLRFFFGLISFLYAIMFAGAAAQVILLLREKPGAQFSALFVAQTAFRLAVAVAFAFVAVKFGALIKEKPQTIKAIVHANFGGGVVFAVLYLLSGTQLNYLGALISILVYVYLLRSVDRISKASLEPQTA